MSPREFRTQESYEAERKTRAILEGFFISRGFRNVDDRRKVAGSSESQTIYATSPSGDRLAVRVKLCWRSSREGKEWYAAAQLLAKIRNGDWEGTLHRFVEHAKQDGITHFLFAQSIGSSIALAALVPSGELVSIWCTQRDISSDLIVTGKLGRRKKNHAMNGTSPTIWLRDDKAPSVAAAVWDHAGVLDLMTLEESIQSVNPESDDTFEDIPGLDYCLFGNDGGAKLVAQRSYVKRDERVRLAVLERGNGRCEREGCGATRCYPGFLDVHHILGVEKSDRVWNCVAICPNCHREAHIAPEREVINAALLAVSMRRSEQLTNFINGDRENISQISQ